MYTISLAVFCLLWGPAMSRLVGRSVDATLPRRLEENMIYEEADGLLVIEAESVPVVAPWVAENVVNGFTGQGYIRMDGNSLQGGDPNGVMSYFFYINSPGNYTMVFRANKNSSNPTWSNDCYTRMKNYAGFQGDLTKTFMDGPANTWRYRTQYQLGDEKLTPLFYFSEPGLQELQVAGRSKNFFIDRIVLYNSDVVNRSVAEDPHQPESFLYVSPEEPAGTEMPETSLPELPSVFIDAGAADEGLSILSGVVWASYFDNSIANVPAGFEEETFKSHRSGESFTCVLSGYKASEMVKVTLGFAENYIGNCRTNKRVMNITVNGAVFATELDVFGTVGCYVAMVLSEEYAADSAGNIIIDFQPVKQNPMVSFIGVDRLREVEEEFQEDFYADDESLVTSTLFFNAGAEDDGDNQVINGTVRTFVADSNISGVPEGYDDDVFQSHVYAESFSYIIPGFPSGTNVVVVLGFSETWVPNCRVGKRIFDVKVNGEDFASNLDIFAQVGCNASLVMSGEFVADENGDLEIQFSPISQNPMVSFVETSVYFESEPGDDIVESDMPSAVPSGVPSDAPSLVPSPAPSLAQELLPCQATNATITSFSLINTTDSSELGIQLMEGDSVALSVVGSSIAVRANTVGPVESLAFLWNGTRYREGRAPWDMVGKTAPEYLSMPGNKTIEARAYDECGINDVKTISFTIIF